MLTKTKRSKWEEYSRGIFYSETSKSVVGYQTNVNGAATINRTSPEGDFLSRCSEGGVKFRSWSLTDLTECQQRRKERRRTKSLTDFAHRSGETVSFGQSPCRTENVNVSEAGRCVTNLLMLNAWRRRRRENEEARTTVQRLTGEVGSLNMQVYVLRELLYSNKSKAISAAKELRKYLLKIEKYGEEYRLIVKEKECLECEIKDLQDLITDLQSKCKNLENDLDTAKYESETWELRTKKERKKLKAVKDENATLREEARSREHQLDYQSQCLDQLNHTTKQLQQELESQRILLNQAMNRIKSADEKLKFSAEFETEQGRIIMEKNREIKELRDEIAEMEDKFQAQDERNGELRKLISEKTKELTMINEKLMELVNRDKMWGKKMVKMASLCTRIPIACVYTVATLLLPQPWYRFL